MSLEVLGMSSVGDSVTEGILRTQKDAQRFDGIRLEEVMPR